MLDFAQTNVDDIHFVLDGLLHGSKTSCVPCVTEISLLCLVELSFRFDSDDFRNYGNLNLLR